MQKLQRSLLAGLLLLVFALAITPKTFIHDIVTDHVHLDFTKGCKDKTIFHKAGVYCDCNNVVATSVFTDTYDEFHLTVPVTYTKHSPTELYWTFDKLIISFSLRGPPSHFNV